MFTNANWIAILCTIAVLLSAAESAPSYPKSLYVNGNTRIVNGTVINIEDAPSTVQIVDSFGIWICAGSLVTPQFIVSAAHCFEGFPLTDIRVLAGVNKSSGNSKAVKYPIENLWLHPDYEFNSTEHMDVAVIKLQKPLAIDNVKIRTIPMCKKPLQATQTATIVGWGRTYFEDPRISHDLRSIHVPVYSKEECIQMHEDSDTTITESMVCAGKPGYQDACEGDSGGPVMRRGKLCGIVSWGVGCADDKYPGVYTSIPVVRSFIDKCLKL